MTASPEVSVVIPTHDRARLVTRAIRSVLDQTFDDLEVIVVDDASSDDTAKAVASLASPKVRYLRHEQNRGAAAARNTGICAARGTYVGLLDDDDEWLPDKVEKQLARFRSSGEDVGLVYCGFNWVSDITQREVLSRTMPPTSFEYDDFLRSTRFGTSTPLIRKDCFDVVGLFDEALPGAQDRDMWLRLAERYRFEVVPDVLVCHHYHGAQITSRVEQKIEAHERLLEKYAAAIERDPRVHASYLRRIGLMRCVAGDRRGGRRRLREAAQREPDDPTSYRHFILSLVLPHALHRRILLKHNFQNVDGVPLFY